MTLSRPLRVFRALEVISGNLYVISSVTLTFRESTYREDHQDHGLTFHNHSQIESHLKAFESFMDDDVLDLRCGDEPRRGRREISRGRGRNLDPETTNDQEGFLCRQKCQAYATDQ